jgi:hypothetical protein
MSERPIQITLSTNILIGTTRTYQGLLELTLKETLSVNLTSSIVLVIDWSTFVSKTRALWPSQDPVLDVKTL